MRFEGFIEKSLERIKENFERNLDSIEMTKGGNLRISRKVLGKSLSDLKIEREMEERIKQKIPEKVVVQNPSKPTPTLNVSQELQEILVNSTV